MLVHFVKAVQRMFCQTRLFKNLKSVLRYGHTIRKPSPMDRNEAWHLLNLHIKNPANIRHALAVEALMRSLAEKFGADAGQWGIAGLLHDMDWEETTDQPERHTEVAAEILRAQGCDDAIIRAIRAHNYLGTARPHELMDKALYSTEEMTGLVTAAVMVLPSRKIADLSVRSIMKKFKEKSFARGVSRAIINETPEMLGLSVEELAEITLHAMQGVHEQLGI